jgi:hypothetical protein
VSNQQYKSTIHKLSQFIHILDTDTETSPQSRTPNWGADPVKRDFSSKSQKKETNYFCGEKHEWAPTRSPRTLLLGPLLGKKQTLVFLLLLL